MSAVLFEELAEALGLERGYPEIFRGLFQLL
jgi:hypothetical protein